MNEQERRLGGELQGYLNRRNAIEKTTGVAEIPHAGRKKLIDAKLMAESDRDPLLLSTETT